MRLEDALHTWPQPTSPHLLRARLAGFKGELTDSNFRLEPCACCAREKRPAKLQHVSFPRPDSSVCPPWLPFTEGEWREHGAEWHRQVDSLLNVKEYMQRAFSVDMNIEMAQAEVGAMCIALAQALWTQVAPSCSCGQKGPFPASISLQRLFSRHHHFAMGRSCMFPSRCDRLEPKALFRWPTKNNGERRAGGAWW